MYARPHRLRGFAEAWYHDHDVTRMVLVILVLVVAQCDWHFLYDESNALSRHTPFECPSHNIITRTHQASIAGKILI